MLYVAIDLGSTNIKVAAYTKELKRLALSSRRVSYLLGNGHVEFDADRYVDDVLALLSEVLAESERKGAGKKEAVVVITGQAETMILADDTLHPISNAISWRDERAELQSNLLTEHFLQKRAYRITGEYASSPVWPAAKLLWFQEQEPQLWKRISIVFMLKDYLIYRLCGVLTGESTTRGFTYLYDVNANDYWQEMLDFIGIRSNQLPPVTAACTNIGSAYDIVCERVGGWDLTINTGLLDHFAGAAGVNALKKGTASESAGTVLSVTIPADQPDDRIRTSWHRGVFEYPFMAFSCCDNGGGCFDWFLQNLSSGMTYRELEKKLSEREYQKGLVFLPYMTGTNAPDFEVTGGGSFYGIRMHHDLFDMGKALQESLAFLLRRNTDHFIEHSISVNRIVSSGGGSRSSRLCQLKADVTGISVEVPSESESVCLGAAMAGAVSTGEYPSLSEAWKNTGIKMQKYQPSLSGLYEEKYKTFCELLDRERRRSI